MNDHGLHLNDVKIKRGSTPLLSIDAHILPGEVLTLMGPSGSGKSTLINAISGFLPKAFSCAGTITLDGENITRLPPERRKVGVLFQDPLLFPHFSVEENILYALPPGGAREERRKKVFQLLKAVDLEECAPRDPATLSGGQQARVALIRVLAADPHALLLDEPFSKLDAQLRGSVRELVFSTVRARNLPTLLVTHDEQDAKAAGGNMIAL